MYANNTSSLTLCLPNPHGDNFSGWCGVNRVTDTEECNKNGWNARSPGLKASAVNGTPHSLRGKSCFWPYSGAANEEFLTLTSNKARNLSPVNL